MKWNWKWWKQPEISAEEFRTEAIDLPLLDSTKDKPDGAYEQNFMPAELWNALVTKAGSGSGSGPVFTNYSGSYTTGQTIILKNNINSETLYSISLTGRIGNIGEPDYKSIIVNQLGVVITGKVIVVTGFDQNNTSKGGQLGLPIVKFQLTPAFLTQPAQLTILEMYVDSLGGTFGFIDFPVNKIETMEVTENV